MFGSKTTKLKTSAVQFPCAFSCARIFAVLTAVLVSTNSAIADPADLSLSEERAQRAAAMPVVSVLSPQAQQLALTLGVTGVLEKLQALHEHHAHKQGEKMSLEGASYRLELTESIVTTMLQCQQVMVEIDAEVAEANEYTAVMSERRDKVVQYNNLANLVTNGIVSTTGNFLQMPQTINEQPGEVMETGSSMLTGGLGVLGLYQQNGEKLSCGIRPNMLAKVFKRPNNESTEYPDVIWNYLNTVPVGSKDLKTRRQVLVDNWEKIGRIPPANTPQGRRYIRILSGTIPLHRTLTLSMLDDRSAMLADLRASVGQIYKELLNLMLVVRAL